MEKISEMIKRLCPEGVEYKLLSDFEERGDITLGRGNVISKTEIRDNPGTYPVYSSSSQNDGKIGEYGKYMFDDERITWSIDGGGILFYRNHHKYSVTNVGGWIKVNTDSLSTRFLYFCLYQQWTDKIFDYTHKAHPSVIRNEYLIPVLPLSVQQEIVRILDSFTSMITNLETELASRQKQYEYYRNKLLNFDENDESVEWKILEEVCDVSRGKRVVRKDLAEYGTIPVYQNSLNPLGYAEKSNYPANTPFVISAGAAGEVGYSFTEYWGADDCFSVLCNEGVNSRFTYHWLKIKEGFLLSRIRGGAIKRLSRNYVDNLEIPIPSLQRQREIVSTLDTFESLISNIKQELEARKKQYEYYREQLLTFRPSPALP